MVEDRRAARTATDFEKALLNSLARETLARREELVKSLGTERTDWAMLQLGTNDEHVFEAFLARVQAQVRRWQLNVECRGDELFA